MRRFDQPLTRRGGSARRCAARAIRDAIRAAGLDPPEIVEPGKRHRFPGNGKRPSNRAGWCLLFDDGLGGCFGDWASGLSETWQAKRDRPYSRAERVAFARRVEAAKAQAETERKIRHANAAHRAARIWNAATAAPGSHPYLIRKRIQPHGARLYKGALTLPILDFAGTLTTVQFIHPNGDKRLLSGGRKRGCCIPVLCTHNTHNTQYSAVLANTAYCADIASIDPQRPEPSRVIICEGWATGCTLAEDEPAALVLAAIDAGNLEAVAVAARRRWPLAELVIAGDDDRSTIGNPGATYARKAAIAADALLALPQSPEDAPESLTDFNDLAVWLAGGGA